jgi:hypothetical protein
MWPKADISASLTGRLEQLLYSLFDHFVGATQHRKRHCQAECLGGLEIDDQFDLGRLLNRQISGFRAVKNLPCADTHQAIRFRLMAP